MKKILFATVVILFSSLLWAGDAVQPLNVKLGLWETTSTFSMSGMPAMPAIPPEALAKLPPEQRARMEQMMGKGGAPSTHTIKYCVTKENLEKGTTFGEQHGNCTNTVVSSSSSGAEVKFHCSSQDGTTDGTAKFQAVNSESVKGTVHVVNSSKGNNATMDMTVISRYLGSSCGDVK